MVKRLHRTSDAHLVMDATKERAVGDERTVLPSAPGWVLAVEAAARVVPRAQLQAPASEFLAAVEWALAAAADHSKRVPPELAGADDLARAAGVGARVWLKRSAWLRENA